MKRTNLAALLTTVSTAFAPLIVLAAPSLPTTPSNARGEALTLSGIVQLVDRAVTILMGLAVTIAVAMIVYAGFRMAFSRGDESMFKEGKSILTNAAIGLLVILGVGIIIKTIGRIAVNPASVLY